MQKHNLAAQPIEMLEFAGAKHENAAVEAPAQENWAQEEHKLRNERREWENPLEKVQALVPGLEFKRFYL